MLIKCSQKVVLYECSASFPNSQMPEQWFEIFTACNYQLLRNFYVVYRQRLFFEHNHFFMTGKVLITSYIPVGCFLSKKHTIFGQIFSTPKFLCTFESKKNNKP